MDQISQPTTIESDVENLLGLMEKERCLNIERKALDTSELQTVQRSENAQQIKKLRDQIKVLKDGLAQRIVQDPRMFELLNLIDKSDHTLACQINQLAVSYSSFFRQRLATTIQNIYNLDDNFKIHSKAIGVSQGFIVESGNIKIYIKESLSYRQYKKINPKELFVYKLLEYTGFGPKSKFLIKPYSTSGRGSNICYISTQDVQYCKSQSKTKTFITDNFDANCDLNVKQWEESLHDQKFLVDLLALSMLDDIFMLDDSFRANAENYGCLKIVNDNQCRYKPKLIDHLPDCKNLEFNLTTTQDAINSLKTKIETNSHNRISRKKQPTICYSLFEKYGIEAIFKGESIATLACNRLLDGKQGKQNSSILLASELAMSEIGTQINQYPDSFVNGARGVLQDYVLRCQKNLGNSQLLSRQSKLIYVN